MSRRTRKQKENSRHRFVLTAKSLSQQKTENLSRSDAKNEAKKVNLKAVVKRQNKNVNKQAQGEPKNHKMARFTAKAENLASIKADTARSLIVASFILSLEVVIYLLLRT